MFEMRKLSEVMEIEIIFGEVMVKANEEIPAGPISRCDWELSEVTGMGFQKLTMWGFGKGGSSVRSMEWSTLGEVHFWD